jgi:hypothetical protein
MDDFTIITDEDKADVSYGACVAATTLTGVAIGRFAGLQGLLVVGGAGLVAGLLACRYMEEPIKQKLFGGAGALTDDELAQALHGVHLVTGVQRKAEAMYLLAAARSAASQAPTGARDAGQSRASAATSGHVILRNRSSAEA